MPSCMWKILQSLRFGHCQWYCQWCGNWWVTQGAGSVAMLVQNPRIMTFNNDNVAKHATSWISGVRTIQALICKQHVLDLQCLIAWQRPDGIETLIGPWVTCVSAPTYHLPKLAPKDTEMMDKLCLRKTEMVAGKLLSSPFSTVQMIRGISIQVPSFSVFSLLWKMQRLWRLEINCPLQLWKWSGFQSSLVESWLRAMRLHLDKDRLSKLKNVQHCQLQTMKSLLRRIGWGGSAQFAEFWKSRLCLGWNYRPPTPL